MQFVVSKQAYWQHVQQWAMSTTRTDGDVVLNVCMMAGCIWWQLQHQLSHRVVSLSRLC